MRRVAVAVVIILVGIAVYEILATTTPTRAVYLALPAVEGVDDNCVFTDITDLVQSGVLVNDTLHPFSAYELVSLTCSEDNMEYSVMIYLDVSPYERRDIENALPQPVTVISNRSVYLISANNYFVPIASEFYFYSFSNVEDPYLVINDSLNLRNSYSLDEEFSMLARIPDRIGYLDPTLKYVKAEFGTSRSVTNRSVTKEWYVGTTTDASTIAYIILKEPKDPDRILGCTNENSTYANVTTPAGILYTCNYGNMCGPKYLIMENSFAYTHMQMVCESVEDVFTTAVLERVMDRSGR